MESDISPSGFSWEVMRQGVATFHAMVGTIGLQPANLRIVCKRVFQDLLAKAASKVDVFDGKTVSTRRFIFRCIRSALLR